ncbi:hypothetical protein A0256_15425 [Mucilaginibacter sp. PAMC 26640]|nr:hypothetical protein A0256_15425 [Mucilaginibacter sp. PAMC 26640]
MAKTEKNPNSILFLYEGETEDDFYKKIFKKYIPERAIRHNFGNLKGVYNVTEKVRNKIKAYLENKSFQDCQDINVFVAIDREGDRSTPALLRLAELEKEFIYEGSRIKKIHGLIATQDLESWFFHDLGGIYKHLQVPVKQRKMNAYPNKDKVNNRVLSELFHRYKKHYQKGRRVAGFVDALDLGLIYENVPELKEAITAMHALIPARKSGAKK